MDYCVLIGTRIELLLNHDKIVSVMRCIQDHAFSDIKIKNDFLFLHTGIIEVLHKEIRNYCIKTVK